MPSPTRPTRQAHHTFNTACYGGLQYREPMQETGTPDLIATIDHEVFRERRQDPSVAVVDVLPETSFVHSHTPGAINLPLAGIRDLADKVLPDKSQEIIVYCATFT